MPYLSRAEWGCLIARRLWYGMFWSQKRKPDLECAPLCPNNEVGDRLCPVIVAHAKRA